MELDQKILSDFTVYTKYARYQPAEQRRETWEELVERNKQMHLKKFPNLEFQINKAYEYVIQKKVLPSMRSLQFGGKAIDVTPNRIYNCSFMPVDSIYSFSEAMFLLLSGTGVGYSVQDHNIRKLPLINKTREKHKRFVVDDSIEGWANAIKYLFKCYIGIHKHKPIFDYRAIREKGATLVTSGGKAPGHLPLKQCLERLESILDSIPNGLKISSLQAHDMMCIIADAVLAGGIRRAALISLFDNDDELMLGCKTSLPATIIHSNGEKATVEVNGYIYEGVQISAYDLETFDSTGKLGWWVYAPWRARSNNSAVFLRDKLTKKKFMRIWKYTRESGAGEPAVYLTNNLSWGTNPCAEIALKPFQFCNLTEINGSNIESQGDLNDRVWAATFLGTLQASYTDFHYLRDIWKETTESEALLGVSITGIASGKVQKLDLREATDVAKATNTKTSRIIGIKKASRITCIKPAGTTSLVMGTSSGIHPWFGEYYIRRMRFSKNEAIYKYMVEELPNLVEDDKMRPHDTAIVSMPQKAPENAILRGESAMSMLERIKDFSIRWIMNGHRWGDNKHNVSATVYVKDEEWDEVINWMWENRYFYNGLSVFPHSDHIYPQAPFEEIDESTYLIMKNHLKDIDLTKVIEDEDNTDLGGELACAGGACEL